MNLSSYLVLIFVSITMTIFGQNQKPFQIYKENNRFGLKDAKQTIIIKPIYLNIKTSKYGIFAIQSDNQKWAVFDREGVRVTDFVYDKMEQELPDIVEVRQGSKIGLVSETGEVLVPVQYDKISPIGKIILADATIINNPMRPKAFLYRGAIVTKSSRSGFLDKKGKLILPIDYERIRATAAYELGIGYLDVIGLVITKDKRCSIVSETGQTILPFEYTYINGLNKLGFGELEQNGKKGLYNKKLEVVVKPIFDKISILNKNLFAGKQGETWKIYNIKNTQKVYAEVDEVYAFANGIARIKKGDKFSIISPNGKINLPFEYNKVVPFGNNVLLEKEKEQYVYTSKKQLVRYPYPIIIPWRDLTHQLKPIETSEGKFGYINDDCELKIDAVFDDATNFRNGIAIVKKGINYGFINKKGKFVLPIEYRLPTIEDEPDMYLIEKNNQYGYVDYRGKIQIAIQYDALKTYGTIIKAKKNGKWGLINNNEKVILPFKYDFLEDFDQKKQTLRFQKGNTFGIVSLNGTETPRKELAYWADDVEEDKSHVRNVRVGRYHGLIDLNNQFITAIRYENKIVFDKYGKTIVKENGHWGMIDKGGNVEIPTIYQEKFRFNEKQLACVRRYGKYGVINYEGKLLINPIYDNFIYTNYAYWTVKKDNKFGITNSDGHLVIPIEYDKVFPYINHLALVKKGNKWGYINEINQPVIPFDYDVLNSFINGRAIAKKKDYWGMIDTKNKAVLSFEYTNLVEEANGFISANKDGLWGIIDPNYNIIIPFKYDKITLFNNYFRIERNNKVGLYSIDGQLILPLFYDALTVDDYGFKVQKDGKTGLINFDGSVVIPAIYDELMYFTNGFARVKKGKKYGMITESGYLAIPCEYDVLGIRFINGYVEAAKNGRYGVLNQKHRTVVKFKYEDLRWINNHLEGFINGEWSRIDL